MILHSNLVEKKIQQYMVVVCDKEKRHKNRIVGASDLIIEILSKSTAKRDRMIKFNKYQQAGCEGILDCRPSMYMY